MSAPGPRAGRPPRAAERTWLSWSSGKDSAWALHVLRANPAFEVVGLLTTTTECFDRVAMRAAVAELRSEGVARLAFGDLFLEDVRRYRERLLAGSGVTPVFPLWKRDTRALARQMTREGLRARIVCVDPARAPDAWAGALFDEAFVRALPEGVDPCAENGEFHTFAFAGPMFARPVAVRTGEVVRRDGFLFADLLPE